MKQSAYTLLTAFFSVFTNFNLSAHETLADNLMEGNKLVSVVVVLAIILAGILLFLFRLERRVRKMEDDINH